LEHQKDGRLRFWYSITQSIMRLGEGPPPLWLQITAPPPYTASAKLAVAGGRTHAGFLLVATMIVICTFATRNDEVCRSALSSWHTWSANQSVKHGPLPAAGHEWARTWMATATLQCKPHGDSSVLDCYGPSCDVFVTRAQMLAGLQQQGRLHDTDICAHIYPLPWAQLLVPETA
jgi:hypothetical protein